MPVKCLHVQISGRLLQLIIWRGADVDGGLDHSVEVRSCRRMTCACSLPAVLRSQVVGVTCEHCRTRFFQTDRC